MYNNNGGQTGPSKGIRLSFLTPTDQVKFEQIFSQGSAAFGGNKISANAVSELLRRSNLDNDSLAKIWDLASIANSPYLSFPEFAVAMFLTSKKLTGQTLPASLPPNVREETELAMATIASTETSQQLVNTQPQQQQQQFMNPQAPMMTGMPSQGMMSSQPTGMMSSQPTGMMSSQQTGMMSSQQTGMMPSQQMNMMTGMNMNHQLRPTPSLAPQQPMQTGYMSSYQSPMQTGFMPPPQQQPPKPRLQNLDFAKKMMPNQNGVTNLLHPNLGTSDANKLSWKISPEDKQRYRDIFNAWEGSGSGFMSGDTAKDVLTQSQLPPQDLMKIWNLADSENRGSLDVDEFAVAMHLVYRKLNGFEIPNTLPAELKPPSSLLKKFVLGRRPPPSTPSFHTPSPKQDDYDDDDYHRDDYVSSSRRKGPQSSSSSRYHRYQDEDEVDVALLEDLRRQISDTKRTLDRMPVVRTTSNHSSKYSLEELKENIRRTQDELNQLSRNNPLSSKYLSNSDTLLDLLETEKSLQDEIQYLCNRDIPILARQVRGAAAELRDTKVRHSRKNDGTQDFMAFIQPTGPGGSITESDRVRAKAKAMMAARKAGNSGSSTDAGYSLRRAEEEKEEADKKADSIEREMERSRTALLDMRGDLRYLEEMTAAQDLEDKKRFEMGGQDLSYELRRFIEQLDTKSEPVSSYGSSTSRHQSFERSASSSSIGYQSPSVASPVMTNTSSPKPKPAPARPRTAEEIKKEAERRVQERLAALQAKRNPGSSPRSISKPSTPSTPSSPFSKPDASEGIAQQRQHDTEREAQESLRNAVNQREESDRRNREAELDRLREQERMDRQRSEEAEKEAERTRKETEEEEKRREEQEEREFQERRRKIVEKEEADRQARFDAIRRDEEEAEQRKQEHKPEEAPAPEVTAPVTAAAAPPPPPPPAPPAPPAVATPSTPSVPSTPNASTSSNNPFAKFQANTTTSPVGSSQAEKPNEPSNKRVSYNPFAAFSAFSATKAGAKDDTDSEDDGWDAAGHDDSDDENEFPAAGSAKNLAGMLFTAMSKRGGNNDPLETVREVNSPKPDENDTVPPPPPAPPAPAASGNIPPPPPAPAAPSAPTASTAPAAGGDLRGALLGQIQSGLKLKKAKTNDRSASSIAGHVIGDDNSPPASIQPVEPPVEITAPTPVSGALSTGGFLAELQGRTQQESPVAASNDAPVDNTPKHDESLPEHEYVALWDYPGSGADDLIFSQDDVIIVRDNNESEDWWFGTLEKTKKTGYFPRNYVQLKPEADPELNIKVKALYDFEGPEGQGCLSFKMGDTITVLVKENDDWWKAQSEDGTQIGLVPANYLEQI